MKFYPGVAAEHSLPCTADVKIEWSHTSIFAFSLMGCAGSTLLV